MTDTIKEQSIIITEAKVLDRLIELGANTRAIVATTLKAPAGMVGVPAEVPYAIASIDGKITPINIPSALETFRTHPSRINETVTLSSRESFIALLNRHKTPASVVFVSTQIDVPKLTAVIDYHGLDGKPQYGNHQLVYNFPYEDNFKVWRVVHGKEISQEEFGTFIEDNVECLSSPLDIEAARAKNYGVRIGLPGQILDLSRELLVNVDAKLREQKRGSNGVREISFVVEHKGQNGEVLNVPSLFYIALPVFEHAEPIRIPVKLTYRVKESSVLWTLRLQQMDQYIRDAIQHCAEETLAKTSVPHFEGGV